MHGIIQIALLSDRPEDVLSLVATDGIASVVHVSPWHIFLSLHLSTAHWTQMHTFSEGQNGTPIKSKEELQLQLLT